MKKYIAVILMSSVLLTGCSSKITEGEIYKKDYQPEETIMIMTPMIHTNGKSSYTTYIPMFYHYPDRWCIWIKATEKNDEGEFVIKDVEPGYVYEVTINWEYGDAQYGFVTAKIQ